MMKKIAVTLLALVAIFFAFSLLKQGVRTQGSNPGAAASGSAKLVHDPAAGLPQEDKNEATATASAQPGFWAEVIIGNVTHPVNSPLAAAGSRFHLRAGEVATVRTVIPVKAGTPIVIDAEDGGVVDGGMSMAVAALDAQSRLSFRFASPTVNRLHRVVLRQGSDAPERTDFSPEGEPLLTLEFWVGDAPAPSNLSLRNNAAQ